MSTRMLQSSGRLFPSHGHPLHACLMRCMQWMGSESPGRGLSSFFICYTGMHHGYPPLSLLAHLVHETIARSICHRSLTRCSGVPGLNQDRLESIPHQ